MKDVHAGAGGVFALALDLLFLYALLSTFAGSGLTLFYPLAVAEAGATIAMTAVIAFGKPLGPGMGAVAIAAAKKRHFAAGLALGWAAIAIVTIAVGLLYTDVSALRLGLAGVAAALPPLAVAAAVLAVSRRNFGGVNGDVMGAANEIGRIAALAAMGAVLWTHF